MNILSERTYPSRPQRDFLQKCIRSKFQVAQVETKPLTKSPAPPFTTSTLQQEASRKLGFSVNQTMSVAQRLYESGKITYMRTDSVNLSKLAIGTAAKQIRDTYGENYQKSRNFSTKSKGAQEAHEAIRPTSVAYVPDDIKGALDKDQLKLYSLIWKRTMACQMVPAVFDTVAIDMAAGDPEEGHRFRANGSVLVEAGFMAVYQEGRDDNKDDDGDRLLPEISEGDTIKLEELRPEQHFTEPPPRFTEASLVKTLEEYGIGRPSTYASIISTLQDREYVELEKKRFHPTDVGRIVNKFFQPAEFSQIRDPLFSDSLSN